MITHTYFAFVVVFLTLVSIINLLTGRIQLYIYTIGLATGTMIVALVLFIGELFIEKKMQRLICKLKGHAFIEAYYKGKEHRLCGRCGYCPDLSNKIIHEMNLSRFCVGLGLRFWK